MINEQKESLMAKEDKKSDISFCFEVLDVDEFMEDDNCAKSYTIFLVTKKRVSKEVMSLAELKLEMSRNQKIKMVMILFENNQRKYIHDMFCEISREKGICSPIIELDKGMLYFPELRYSDLGLLMFLCERNIDNKDYRLFMSSGNLIGGRYV